MTVAIGFKIILIQYFLFIFLVVLYYPSSSRNISPVPLFCNDGGTLSWSLQDTSTALQKSSQVWNIYPYSYYNTTIQLLFVPCALLYVHVNATDFYLSYLFLMSVSYRNAIQCLWLWDSILFFYTLEFQFSHCIHRTLFRKHKTTFCKLDFSWKDVFD